MCTKLIPLSLGSLDYFQRLLRPLRDQGRFICKPPTPANASIRITVKSKRDGVPGALPWEPISNVCWSCFVFQIGLVLSHTENRQIQNQFITACFFFLFTRNCGVWPQVEGLPNMFLLFEKFHYSTGVRTSFFNT